jgi:long-chain acyl-CoA synthetase
MLKVLELTSGQRRYSFLGCPFGIARPYGANGWWYEMQLKNFAKIIFMWKEGLGI